MKTVDCISVQAPLSRVYAAAADVERWPDILPHYRWVKTLERHSDWDLVEMAAWRRFGAFRYPTWWVSEMRRLPERHEVRYRHVHGVTRGMEVVWALELGGEAVHVSIVHTWTGPAWPLIGGLAASWVIGPVFIHAIASRTLAGIRRFAEGGRDGP